MNKETPKRCAQIAVHVTPEEKKLIDGKKKDSGLSMPDFLLRCVQGTPVIVIDRAGEILQELKREGNNLNQALRNVYASTDSASDEAGKKVLMQAAAECMVLYKEITKLLKGAAGETHDASL